MRDEFRRKTVRFIEEHRLFGAEDKVLVAVSGGADSVALLQVLLQEGYRCVAAHCNFQLRGEEADRDEAFVRGLCREKGVELHVTRFPTAEYAREHGISLEMAARELRYAWFEQVRRDTGAAVIAVAHHRDDNVETFLLNLVRGTGINGLKGMRPVRGCVVRPLLSVGREDILRYLQAMGQPYVTDSTNLQDIVTRNKLRLDVLPLLRTINPSVSEAIAATAERLSEVAVVYRSAMEEACRRVTDGQGNIHIARLLAETAPQAVLFELLHPKGFNATQLQDIFRSLSAVSGKRFHAPGFELLRDREWLWVRARGQAEAEPVLRTEFCRVDATFEPPRSPQIACLDADRLQGRSLVVRKWQAGDRFVPLGMKGFKRVRDYLRDRKRSLFEKERQYVVEGGGDIVWLVGERIDQRFRVTEQTRRVLLLWVEPPVEESRQAALPPGKD
ncbi:MAG: tRNA lysidine(34) synthetase TilS [Bacteroidales bacterium]|nr:tRNA lysidine(34) synthetase TilS [Bacteroidales bacterium]